MSCFILTEKDYAKLHFLLPVSLFLSSHSYHLFSQQANPLSTSSLLGSNQNHAALHGLEFDLPPYLEAKYNTGSTTNPRPAISMQEVS